MNGDARRLEIGGMSLIGCLQVIGQEEMDINVTAVSVGLVGDTIAPPWGWRRRNLNYRFTPTE